MWQIRTHVVVSIWWYSWSAWYIHRLIYSYRNLRGASIFYSHAHMPMLLRADCLASIWRPHMHQQYRKRNCSFIAEAKTHHTGSRVGGFISPHSTLRHLHWEPTYWSQCRRPSHSTNHLPLNNPTPEEHIEPLTAFNMRAVQLHSGNSMQLPGPLVMTSRRCPSNT